MRRLLPFFFLLLVFAVHTGRADLTFPAIFKVVEEAPGRFHLTLTVPLVKGRYMKVSPVVPERFHPVTPPELRTGEASLTRSWKIEADRTALFNEVFGLEGLSGTSVDVRFLLTTLDGRRFETDLRPTCAVFVVPEPSGKATLAAQYGREGLRSAVRSFGFWIMTACLLFSGIPGRIRSGGLFLITAGFTGLWVSSIAFPQTFSDSETRAAVLFFVLGGISGSLGIITLQMLAGSLMSSAVRSRISGAVSVSASGWVFYQGGGLFLRNGSVWMEWLQLRGNALVRLWFSPFAADWAMARLRIPLLSVTVLLVLVFVIIKVRRRRIRFVMSVCLLVMTFVLLPYGVVKGALPFAAPQAPTVQRARFIVEPMLTGIYHALNLEDESQTYDKLAEQVSGNLATDLYLDSRRRLLTGIREGASVAVKQVVLQDISIPFSAEPEHPVYRCRWTVTARVTHWQHIHERENLYEGDLLIGVEDGVWKLTGLNLYSEERKVVPGSFVSR